MVDDGCIKAAFEMRASDFQSQSCKCDIFNNSLYINDRIFT